MLRSGKEAAVGFCGTREVQIGILGDAVRDETTVREPSGLMER